MSNALRIFLRELRISKGITQEKAADSLGWSTRSFNEWETGKNEDIKSRYFIRLILLLEAHWNDIVFLEMNEISEEEVIKLLQQNYQNKKAFNDSELQQLTQQLWSDDKLRFAFLIFWAGWKSRNLDK